MANKKPSFVTGASAKVKAGDKTIAYAQDVSYSVTVTTIPIETMGRYEVVSNEPVSYACEGTLNVIRYTKVAQENSMSGAIAGGNGIGNWKFSTGGEGSEHMNPGKMLLSQTWDLDVFQKLADGKTEPVEKLTDCRFTRKSGTINKRGVLVEQFSFVAILSSDPSFVIANSGDDDLA